MTKRNTAYIILIQAPLVRPGMTLKIGPVSEKYVVEEATKALALARQINEKQL